MESPVAAVALAAIESWKNLKAVETIYEEEYFDSSSSTAPSLSSSPPLLSPTATSLWSRIKAWSLSNGLETNVVVHVQGTNFHLHKDPLALYSGYLKRHFTQSCEITLSPPLKITPHTFTLVADYCYGGRLFITPFNVAALLLAADLLEMIDDSDTFENLRRKTEGYFCRTVAVDHDYAAVVLQSCMSLLPEAETNTALVSRCIEALSLKHDVAGDVLSWFEGVQNLSRDEFQLVVASLHRRLTGSHDLLYRIVDFYLKQRAGKITEEDGARLCNYIDCTNLSSHLLMHAVQNPRMPLRFVVQAMFIEQLNTRRSVFSVVQTFKKPAAAAAPATSVTLGAILQRDAALRQVAHLRASMDSTSSRIESLEDEINGMRKILTKSETDRVKSESFRFSSERKVERGQRGSVSSGSFRVGEMGNGSDYDSGLGDGVVFGGSPSPRRFGKRVMNGLKSAFRVSGLGGFRTRDEMKGEKNS